MWQKLQEKFGGENFTVVGLALDAEGIKPAKMYYDKYKVGFPALVDPNYATKFQAVPKTFFIDEHGVVKRMLRGTRGLEKLIQPANKLRPVTATLRAQWSKPNRRLDDRAIAQLALKNKKEPANLQTAVRLASRFLDLKKVKDARVILQAAVAQYEPKKVVQSTDKNKIRLLGEAHFQLSRASAGDRKAQVKHATLAFYLKPSLGYAKQIARIIAPDKFDNRPRGDFDNRFRESTRRRLYEERRAWLKNE